MKNNILLMQTIILILCLYAIYSNRTIDSFGVKKENKDEIFKSINILPRKNTIYGSYGIYNEYFNECNNINIKDTQWEYLLR